MSIPCPVIGPKRTPINALIYANNLLNSIQLPPKPGWIIQPGLSKAWPSQPDPNPGYGAEKSKSENWSWKRYGGTVIHSYAFTIWHSSTFGSHMLGNMGFRWAQLLPLILIFCCFHFFFRLNHNLKPAAWNQEQLHCAYAACAAVSFSKKKSPRI